MINLMEYQNLVTSIATKRYNFFRMYSHHITLNDSIQSGYLGLCLAKEKYDLDKNKTFGNFARWFIQGEVMKYIFSNLSIVKVNIKGHMSKVKKYIKEEGETDIDIMSNYLGIDEVLLEGILDMIHGRNINTTILNSKINIERIGCVNNYEGSLYGEMGRLLNLVENLVVTCKFLYSYPDNDICEIASLSKQELRLTIEKAKNKLSKSSILKDLYCEI